MTTWKQTEIQRLKDYYTQGLPIKKIAEHLGRSQTALSKAITRFNLLQYRPPQTIRRDYKHFLDNTLGTPPIKQSQKTIFIKRFFALETREKWVDFKDVLYFLSQQNIKVNMLHKANNDGEALYSLNNKTVVSSQILLVANRIRVENADVPFKVKNLSW
ncbi:MAG TPA: hypothetical protein DIC42_04850 [Holosporales bacterium]|nr:hypothetical protein [Holosporales bacterium]